jgi:para-aminobenzoate synthetase/4-amino-4-deoxychorismate lyase
MNNIKPHRLPARENDVLLREGEQWLHFARPQRIMIAQTLDEVLPVLHEIEQLIDLNGWYAAGFISYEAAPAFDRALQTRPSSDFPFLWLGLYRAPRVVTLPAAERPREILEWRPTVERGAYDRAIAKIKGSIGDGHTYQVNYTMRLRANCPESPWEAFLHLAQEQNQHAAYVDTGRYVICSASPELFFRLDGDQVTCRPMKGTTQRGRTTAEDCEQSEWLQNSEKNRAENVMIVDMIRNDLGRIARTGSVSVTRLFESERYRTLWQMTSTVTAQTACSVADILTALFPCASITGAPKVSTMKIIAELEGTPRKIYTGSIGYISPDRKAKFNVAIRTMLIDRKRQQAEYGVGGGIVWDSTSADEYDEALLKARILTEQRPSFSLLETMLWTPQEGFYLREKHIARMINSANYFDIPSTREKLEEYLEQVSCGFQTPQRVRVLLDQTGTLTFEAQPYELQVKFQALRVCLARSPIDSRNVFLFHKTTQRTIYESARQGCETFDDVLLYNEAGELTEFTIGNLVVELDGQLLTPPITCGVLPGTFRAHLLETGQALERTITVRQLQECTQIFRVNSIRNWQRVEIEKMPAGLKS